MKSTHKSVLPRIELLEGDPLGDGIVYTRTCAEEPDTATARCRELARRTAELGQARLLIAVNGMSGVRPYETRNDLVLLLQRAAEGWCHWVAIESYDRIARSEVVLVSFLSELHALRVELLVLDRVVGRTPSASFPST
jgi:hypothetical protein